MAEYKAKKANLILNWQHGLAEATNFKSRYFDLISIAFLFHEMPVQISQEILQECWRMLDFGGQIIILDGNQKRLRNSDWLIKVFREPYSKVYAAENLDSWLENASFQEVETHPVGWISQITTGFKLA